MKIVIGTLKSKIQTDNPKLLRALRDLYSFKVPGAEFTHQYKRNRWDGKQCFISRGGEFRTGLLSRLLNDLQKINCIPELEYTEPSKEINLHDKKIERFDLYPFQEELIDIAIREKRGIIKAPTGAGKTLIMATIIKSLHHKKIVVLFNAKQLLKQTYQFLTEACDMDNIGFCCGEGFIYGDIMLCTVQSIEKILDTHLDFAEILLIDECHEFSKGKLTLAAIQAFPKALYRIGFTATPPTEDIPTHALEGSLGPVWEVTTTSELIEEGKLTEPIIQLIDRPYSASGADEFFSYSEVYDNYIVHNPERNNLIKSIVEEIENTNENARILILTKSLDHGRTLEALLGNECKFLEGANSLGERYQNISYFRKYEGNSILIGTKILQTGINIEEITHFINARGMKSEIATIQALGRALRRHESKEKVYIYDFLDKEKYLKEHSTARKKYYKKEGHEIEII